MPSLSISTALLVMGGYDGLPWTSQTWQGHTKVSGVPWDTQPEAAPDSPSPHIRTWTNRVADGVKTYARNLWAVSDAAEQTQYSRGFSDNDCAGRTAWNKLIQENWNKRWRMGCLIDEVFAECKCSPFDAMARARTRKLPSLEDAQVSNQVTVPLAHALLGESAFQEEDANFLDPAVKNFIDTLISQTWNRYRKTLVREGKRLEKDQATLEQEWKDITGEGARPTAEMIKSYLARLRRTLTVLTRYKDQRVIDQLCVQQKTLEAMLAVAQNDDEQKGEVEKLPKVLRNALQKLSSEKEIRVIEHLLQTVLENIDPDQAPQVQLPEGGKIDFPWKEGTEDLSMLSEDDLWSNLGLWDSKALPFFQEYTDPDGVIDPWSGEGERWLASESSAREVLRPRWHQLVGIYRMIERGFQGKPILLMDGVGIGKTLQVIGLMACLAFYRRFFQKNGKFPGAFGNNKWQGQEGNIPDLPFIIVCPVNLHSQWTREIERFLKRGTFDLFPYTGKLSSRRSWWSGVFTKSHHDPSRRIILATENAIQDDASAIFVGAIRHVEGEINNSPAFASKVMSTLYGREYLAVVVDEAHVARKFNKIHTAACALRERSGFMVSMTATPVMTKLQDLWIMGHLMGIRTFFDRSGYDEMNRDLNRAQAKDRRAERESDDAADRLRVLLSGEDSHDQRNTNFYPVLQKYVPRLRDGFSDHVIRRTLDSVDHLGHKIFGMRPYHEKIMLVELRQWEREALTSLTDDIIEQAPLSTLCSAGKNFYIEFRRGLLHPYMNPHSATESWQKPRTLSEWEIKPSTKLDILAKLVHHHLQKDNARPLKVSEDGQSLKVDTNYTVDDLKHPECDRVVVFSAFPSSNAAICDVLALYGIKTVQLHGKTTHAQRKSVLKEFRSSTHNTGARVLILSMVGTVGLNLACASVMIVADTLWSALDDEQLRGRIYRFPQKKQVYFYRLVARGTPDVFLNNLAFDKGVLHLAFAGMDSKSLVLFNGDHPHLDPTNSVSDASDPEHPEQLLERPPQPPTCAPKKKLKNKKFKEDPTKNSTTDLISSKKRAAPAPLILPDRTPTKAKKQRVGPTTPASPESDNVLSVLDLMQDEEQAASTTCTERTRPPSPATNPTTATFAPFLDLDVDDSFTVGGRDELMIESFGDVSSQTAQKTAQSVIQTSARGGLELAVDDTLPDTRSIFHDFPSPSPPPALFHSDRGRAGVSGVTRGVGNRRPRNSGSNPMEGLPSSSRCAPVVDPLVEAVGGRPLIPLAKGRFGIRASNHSKANRRSK